MKVIPSQKVEDKDFLDVYNEWKKLYILTYQKEPNLTSGRKIKISEAVLKYSKEDILKVLIYLQSNDNYAVFMRTNKYVSLLTIFRPTKWHEKVSKADAYISKANKEIKKQEFFVPYIIVDGRS